MRRRVASAASSPEVVRLTDACPCSAAESSFRQLDDVFLQTQTRIWLGEVLHIRFDEETTIADLLADGELLFQVSQVVWKMLARKHAELRHSKVHIYERTSSGKKDGRYMPYPKVDSFLTICQLLGLTGADLFSPSDVVEKRYLRRVCMCIRSFSKKVRLKDVEVPDFDIVTYTIAMPTDFVGGLRRNLEQSQCTSSSSSGYSLGMDSSEINRQRRFGGAHAENDDSYSEYSEAENVYPEPEFQSPCSDTSYNDSSPSHVVDEISSDGNSMFDESSSALHYDLQEDSLDRNQEGDKSKELSAVLTDSSRLEYMKESNDSFRVVGYGKLRGACLSEKGEITWPNSNSETAPINVGFDCLGMRASFEDFPFNSGKQLAVNEEAFEGYEDAMFWSKDLQTCEFKHMLVDSYKNLKHIREELMGSSLGPSGQAEEVDFASGCSHDMRVTCAILDKETSLAGSTCTIEEGDGKHNCSTCSDIGPNKLPLRGCIMNTYAKKENDNSSFPMRNADRTVSNAYNGIHSTVTNNVNLEVSSQGKDAAVSSCDPSHEECIAGTSRITDIKGYGKHALHLAFASVEDPCSKENIEERCQVLPLVRQVFTSMKHNGINDNVEGTKDLDFDQCKTEEVILPTSSTKDNNREESEPHKPGRKMLKSIAGGFTLAGAMFLYLYLREGRSKDENRRTNAPLQTQKSFHSGKTQVEPGNSGGLYPAERLKF